MSRLFAGLDAGQFVETMYKVFLLRLPDPGAQDKIDRLNAGVTDAEGLIAELLSSDEYKSLKNDTRLFRDQTQYGELEQIVRRWLLKAVPERWVVDIGARGKERSNSWDLLKHFGWKGLLIEANRNLIASIDQDFADLDATVLNCAISDYEGEATFYLGINDDVSSLNREASSSWGDVVGEVTVPVRRLPSLLKENNVPEKFGLLSIDIEGEDIKVLNDLIVNSSYRPQWVLIEASYNFKTINLRDLPFDRLVESSYRIVDHTPSNLLLESTSA